MDSSEEDKENSPHSAEELDADESEVVEVQIGRGGGGNLAGENEDVDEGSSLPSPPPPKKEKKKAYGGRWAAIDDFEMDFEDVSLGSQASSSDVMAR